MPTAGSSSSSELAARARMDITSGTNWRGKCEESTADSSQSPSAHLLQEAEEGKRKRKRQTQRTATTSSLPLHQLPAEKAAMKNTDSSSQSSSPLRRPKSLLMKKKTSSGTVVYEYNSDKEVVKTYHKNYQRYKRKLARMQQLPTLKPCKYAPDLTDWHDLKQKKAVLDVAKSVVSLSSSHDDKEIGRCSGIIIEWIEVNKSAIIVTSSQIICMKTSLDDWEDNNVYTPNAKVIAYLLDGTTSELTLLYFSKHYDIAFFKIIGGAGLQVASLDLKFEFGHEACVVGRDKDLDFICRRTILKALDPCDHQKNHYSFINATIPGCCTGGALANFDRNVIGMVVNAVPNTAFIPSCLILNCLILWKKFGQIARPHIGLKLRTVGFLDISNLEHLSRMFGIESGLIVAKVCAESPAERNGIRIGDVIFSCQGEAISTISQLEEILLDVCDKHFQKGYGLNSEVNVELGVYNLRKHAGKYVTLSVELSDSMEA